MADLEHRRRRGRLLKGLSAADAEGPGDDLAPARTSNGERCATPNRADKKQDEPRQVNFCMRCERGQAANPKPGTGADEGEDGRVTPSSSSTRRRCSDGPAPSTRQSTYVRMRNRSPLAVPPGLVAPVRVGKVAETEKKGMIGEADIIITEQRSQLHPTRTSWAAECHLEPSHTIVMTVSSSKMPI